MLQFHVLSQKRLEELRELNRETFKATGEYMTEVRQLRVKVADQSCRGGRCRHC
jgi:hypothetical protein